MDISFYDTKGHAGFVLAWRSGITSQKGHGMRARIRERSEKNRPPEMQSIENL